MQTSKSEPDFKYLVSRLKVIAIRKSDGKSHFERRVTKGNRKPKEEPATVKLNSAESGDQSSNEANSGSAA